MTVLGTDHPPRTTLCPNTRGLTMWLYLETWSYKKSLRQNESLR